jgi:hypothetical protein
MVVRECRCGHPEGDHKWNRSNTYPRHGVCLVQGCGCREFQEVDGMSVIERYECREHALEAVEPVEDAPLEYYCVICAKPCELVEYVHPDTYRGAVGANAEALRVLTTADPRELQDAVDQACYVLRHAGGQ